MKQPQPGEYYTHYKNDTYMYKIIGVSIHTETEEVCVIYQSEYETDDYPYGQIWIRPLSMFMESVEVDGKHIPRFQKK